MRWYWWKWWRFAGSPGNPRRGALQYDADGIWYCLGHALWWRRRGGTPGKGAAGK